MARIPDARAVPGTPSPRDPGVRVPAVGMEIAEAGNDLGRNTTGIALRRLTSAEAADRVLKESEARELAFRAFNDWEKSGNIAELDSPERFVQDLNSEFTRLKSQHAGRSESRAALESRLEEIRLDAIVKATTASTMARQDIIISSVQRRQAETVNSTFNDPSALGGTIAEYDKTMDELQGALGDRVVEQLRQDGRAVFVKSAMDGALARGDLNTVASVLAPNSPYTQYLSPGSVTTYRAQLAKAKQQQVQMTAGMRNIAYLKSLGINLTPEETKAALGVPVPSDTRTPGEKAVAAAEAAGLKLTDDQRARMLGVPDTPDDRTSGEKTLAALDKAGVNLTDEQRATVLGAPEPPPPDDFTVALNNMATSMGVSVEELTPAQKKQAFDVVYKVPQPGGPFEGTSQWAQSNNMIIGGVDRYASGRMTEAEEFAFEQAAQELAADRINAAGERIPGSISPRTLRALQARGKTYDPVRNAIVTIDGLTPAPGGLPSAPPAPPAASPGAGPLNGQPAASGSPPPPLPPSMTPGAEAPRTDIEMLDQLAGFAQGKEDDLSLIAQANLFGRAEDITGPNAKIAAWAYSTPYLGPTLISPDAYLAQDIAGKLTDALARARRESKQFAWGELKQLKEESRLSGSWWDNPERFRNGLVALDEYLAAVEQNAEAFIAGGGAPKDEKQRLLVKLDAIKFVRQGLGVQSVPHPASLEEAQALPPGTVFIANGRVYTRAAY